ncbi:tryptophan synthase beta subunit-like PLP-dependent enzyme [Parachaetomium inaequale]|uniref:L-serine ammonia-lyase n=1 Tax=Parachaetomium inaequale TaxID=2588326 RepID=A0AAN6PSZ2_9PEZI|nr:tryptophan synthase beta subunit-like PLP-dependent enzyme [Parachaetomium inaequale]
MGSFSPDPPKPWVETPLIFSPPLSRVAGCNIFLKLDNTQPSGSFKSRGIGNMMLTALSTTTSPSDQDQDPLVHFYCSSGGNAGLACATTAATLRRPATIVVPTSTSAFMVSKLRELGAHVVQTGASWVEADTYLRETLLIPETPGVRKVYVPPFDHPDIWAGAATIVDEIAVDFGMGGRFAAAQPGGLDAVVCNVGGGGLLNGVMEGLERNGKRLGGGRDGVKVLAVETVGAESLYASVQAGELVTLPGITSIATSLGARRVSEKTWEWAQKAGREKLICSTVTDKEAAMACVRFLDDARILIEVACGATVATAYNGDLRRYLGKGLADEEWATRNVVLVVCGGSNTSAEILEKYKETYGIE